MAKTRLIFCLEDMQGASEMAGEDLSDAAPKWRSPPYPSFDLRKALVRSEELVNAGFGAHRIPLALAVARWGYGPKSSGGIQTVSTLIQFGLLAQEGSGEQRRLRLTEDAIRIAKDRDARSEKRLNALHRVAFTPKIHKELWDRFGTAAVDDALLITYLTLDRSEEGKAPYSEAAAMALIQEYRDTLNFLSAESPRMLIDTSGQVAPADEPDRHDVVEAQAEPMVQTHAPAQTRMVVRRFDLMNGERELQTGMLSKTAAYRVVVTGRIGVKEIERLIRKLEMDKEILADEASDDDEEAPVNVFD